MTNMEKQVLVEMRRLGSDQQRRVLEFTKTLTSSLQKGTRGTDLLPFAGAIAKGDLNEMAEAIERGCEKVNADEW